MSRPPAVPAADKVRIVLSTLAGEMRCAEAARRSKVSETTIGNWKRQFLAAAQRAWRPGGQAGPNAAERALAAEVEELKTALGEAMSSCWCGRSPRSTGWALIAGQADPDRPGLSLLETLTDPHTGEITPIILVTDNGGPAPTSSVGSSAPGPNSPTCGSRPAPPAKTASGDRRSGR
jgi:transposase